MRLMVMIWIYIEVNCTFESYLKNMTWQDFYIVQKVIFFKEINTVKAYSIVLQKYF